MASPGNASKTIGDLIPDVIDALQGRTDVTPVMVGRYVRRAIQEITESYPFEELRRTGPLVQLEATVSTYPASFFLNSGQDYTSPESFGIYIDFPNNSVVGLIDYKTPKAIEPLLSPATIGIPSVFTRYGTNFMFGPVPAQPYSVFLRYQMRHPFPEDVNALTGQRMFIPDSWEEIVAYSAALRIAIVKRWTDQQKSLHDILYGDPEFQMSEGKRGRPGIMAARIFQIERDQRFNSRSLGIRTARYNVR